MRKIESLQLKSIFFLLLMASLNFVGCKKQTSEPVAVDQTQQVSMNEIINWVGALNLKIADQPILLFELAQKTSFKGNSYIRVPAFVDSVASGFFYFSKGTDGTLQSLYVVTNQNDRSKLEGNVGFVDFDHKSITVATYQDNKPIAFNTLKNTNSVFNDFFTSGGSAIRKQIYSGGGVSQCGDKPKSIWQILGDFFQDVWDSLQGDQSDGVADYSNESYATNYLYWDFSGFIGNDISNSGPYPVGWRPYVNNSISSDPYPDLYWKYLNDDGTTSVDPNSSLSVNFKFDPLDNYDYIYPKFTNLVKNLKYFVKDNPEVMNALQTWSGLSKQQIIDNLTYGQGLLIKIEDQNMDGRYAYYNKNSGVKVMHVRASYVRGLEMAILPSTKKATAFLLAVSVLHELVHYGTNLNHISEGIYDFGYGFEKDAFNIIVDDDNAGNVVVAFKIF